MIQNKRDLGGIRTASGQVIKPGMLIRSAQLAQAEEQDLIGISTVIDLRTPGERQGEPDQVHGCEYLPLPIFEDRTVGVSHEQDAAYQGIPEMSKAYRMIAEQCAPAFRRVLLTIMAHDFTTGAVLWHCTEGKDRCGITTALVLEALGVERTIIMEDYLKTNLINLPKAARIREQLIPSHGEAFADRIYQAYIADEKYLQAAWDAMGKDYLRDTLKIDDSAIQSFRRTILEN